MEKNYEIRIAPNRIPWQAKMLAEISINFCSPEVQFATVLLLTSHYVFDVNKDEFVEGDEAKEWIMEYVTEIGPEAFQEEIKQKQIAFLKTQGIHVKIVELNNYDPRSN